MGNLGGFQILAIISNAVVNIGVQCIYSFELGFQVSSDIFPEVESLGHKAAPFLIFLR